ncbi:xylose isomerase [Treponema primitia ZAS-2]|uniref:Xylose isomerase n=1 Tax=Treponema primitia (strain ATCC BAA-887 / DSM 12427 / ZAS-2) TaxID=545694 RepID=F5YH08_TREPZ|nr:xylose isomerase [Treponema primitia]AEF85442.1 xylose isomerase [Treponema primitia ZAS-2]
MANYFIGNKEFFPGIGKIPYEGSGSKNPLAFKYYDAEKTIRGKKLRDWLRFAIAYWHSFCADGADPFGVGTHIFPWNSSADPMENAKNKADAAFEFFTKINAPYYCWHDRDIAPEGKDPEDSAKNLSIIVDELKKRQDATGVKLLWGTANVFSNPRFMNGAATNPEFAVVTHAANQVKNAIDGTIKLGGEGYTFWGGREGYMSLLNTDMKREKEHLAVLLTIARDYARKQGFKGCFYIEPKPMEPTKHQYDFDSETVIGFLKAHGLEKDFKLNIEANHAELAGHDFYHELSVCVDNDMLGSVDANRGEPRNGWDTDQFPNSVYETSLAMLAVLRMGGFKTGGLNFDAKIRRNSVDPADLFIAHIGGMDTFAYGFEKAVAVLDDGRIPDLLKARYASFDSGDGAKFEKGGFTLDSLAALAKNYDKSGWTSGKQEYLENVLGDILLSK